MKKLVFLLLALCVFPALAGCVTPAEASPYYTCNGKLVRKNQSCPAPVPVPAPAPTPAPTPAPVPAPLPPPPVATQTCGDGAVIPLTQICAVPPTPCPSGTQWNIATGHCEAIAPAPAPAPAPVPSPAPVAVPSPAPVADPPGSANNPVVGQSPGVGAPDIATTDHNVMDDLIPGQPIPPTGAPDVVGAFRFICRHTDSRYDDHVVFYGQPGKSHLHDETGVYGWDAFSNYGNLRSGQHGSGCDDVAGADGLNQPVIANDPKVTHAANRTPYEQPALLDGMGNVINPDLTLFYYKRRPSSDPVVSDPANPQYMGHAVTLPNGIKFLFGNHPDNPAAPFDSNVKFMCTSSTPDSFGSDMLAALKACQGSATGQFEARVQAPGCWDGVNLDSPDHRSHLAYATYGGWGYLKCDAQHPYVIPEFTYGAQYTIAATDDVTKIHFSSDEMDPTKPAGWSFHVDYGPMAWDPIIFKMAMDNCIEKLLSCSGGDLGNGYRLKGAAQPIYLVNGVYTSLWRNPVRLVPVPPRPAP